MKRWLLMSVPLLVLTGLIGWRLNVRKMEAAAQAQQRANRGRMAPLVAVAPVAIRDIVQTFEAIGTVEAPFNVPIAPRASGRIEYLQVREGDRVTPGQVLARLDLSEIEAEVRRQEAALAEARARLAQAQINQAPTDVSVRTQIRQQEAALTSAQADLKQAQETYTAQQAEAAAKVVDAQARVSSEQAAIRNAQALVRSALANLENARSRLNRLLELYRQGFIAAQDVDDARTAVRVQQEALEVARGQLSAAEAQRDSARAQQQAAERQADIVKTKGRADIAAAQARVQQAQAALDYAQANTAQRPAFRQNLAALRAAVAAQEAALRSAQARRADTVLIAPLHGVVTARHMDPGAMATPGQAILTVQAIQQVWVTVPVPAEVSRSLAVGQSAHVTFDALPRQEFTGRIVRIHPAADPQSRQFTVRITLDNPRNLLKPGMFGRARFVTERVVGAVVVPREAVQSGPQGSYVVVVNEESVAQHRPVVLGASDPAGYAVRSGVQPGEKVVVLSAAPVRDGVTVRVSGERRGRGSN